jgi:hypothetical protein
MTTTLVMARTAFSEHLENKVRENECGLFTRVLGDFVSCQWETAGTPNHPAVKGGPYERRRSTWRVWLGFIDPATESGQLSYYELDTNTTAICNNIYLERMHGKDGKHFLAVPCYLTLDKLVEKKDAIINEVFTHWKHGLMFEKELEERSAQLFGVKP